MWDKIILSIFRETLEILSILSPVTTTDVSSTASGLSWDSLIFRALKFKIDDSSNIVPLSERTTNDSICNLL